MTAATGSSASSITAHGTAAPGDHRAEPPITNTKAGLLLDAEADRLRSLINDLEQGGVVERTGTDEHLGALEDTTFDGGTELAERSMELGMLDSFETQLAEVDAARSRLAAGTYGLCERCGEAIATERLAAQPSARSCARHSNQPS